MTESTLTKTERISLRLDPTAKHKIEHAAALSNRSINGFILASVLEHADEIIQTDPGQTEFRADQATRPCWC